MNNYDLIAKVDISIETPIVEERSFGNLLIVGPLPTTAPATAPALIGEYSNLNEVLEAGWGPDEPVAVAAQVAFAQTPTPSQVYIAPIQTVTTGEDNETITEAESVEDTIERALANSGWYILCTAGVSADNYTGIATLIEKHERIFIYTECEFDFENGTASVDNTFFRTIAVFGKESANQAVASIPGVNNYLNVAYAAKWLNFKSGSETAAFKQLNLVKPGTFANTDIVALNGANINYFTTIGNRNVTMGGKVMAGEWADVIRFRDWQKNDMQVRVANVFINNPKVPFTDAGIALVHNAMIASLTEGQLNGGIVQNEFDEDGNEIPGFTTWVPTAASITASQRASRRLVNCKFKARQPGAIHLAELTGSLTYEM